MLTKFKLILILIKILKFAGLKKLFINKKYCLVLFFFFSIVFNNLFSQNNTNYFGKEFWFTLLENYRTPDAVMINIHSQSVPNVINLKVAGVPSQIYTVYSKDTTLIYRNINIPNPANFITPGILSETRQGKSSILKSQNPVVVSVINSATNSVESSYIIPLENIPKNPLYYINTYKGFKNLAIENNSQFIILAIDDSCQINITPTQNTKFGFPKNITFKFWLKKGETYQVQANDSFSFSGTKIWNSNGCKKFVVFEGVKCALVGYENTCEGCEHLFNQCIPLQFLDKEFVTIPINKMSKGYFVSIVGSENNTTVNINGGNSFVINESETRLINQNDNEPICISADKKISVNQINKSGVCNGNNLNIGNPALFSIVGNNKMTYNSRIKFHETRYIGQTAIGTNEFYITVVSKIGDLKNLKVNNSSLDSSNIKRICNYSVVTIQANYGQNYDIKSSTPFLSYMYAHSNEESFASSAAFSFDNNLAEFEIETGKYPNYVCDSTFEFVLNAKTDSLSTFKWNFSDGSFLFGDTVKKIFNKNGQFKIDLIIQYSQSSKCENDTISSFVNVFPKPFYYLGKDSTYCKGDFIEFLPFVSPKTTFQWHDGSNSSSKTFSNSGKYWLTISDSNRCDYTDTINLNFINCDTNSIKIGNVFSPFNKDGYNDLFEVDYTGFDILEGYIYNRWGVLIYDFKHPEKGFWNGCLQNNTSQPCPTGTYYYYFYFKNNKTLLDKTINGVVMLLD